MSDDKFSTLAVSLEAFRRWQRRHGLAGMVTLVPKDDAASALMLAGIRGDGYTDVDRFLHTFSDVLELKATGTATAI